jgi:hypothetical protein
MADRYEMHWRLEPDPARRSLAAGFAAAVQDPVWFLSRQWQLGEHQGENATTPVLVDHDSIHTALTAPPDLPLGDPAVVPAEALVEAEVDSWWTLGRRVRVGAVLARDRGIDLSTVDPSYLLADPPPPYERLAGGLDGLAAWRSPGGLGLSAADFAGFGVPADRPLRWDPAELVYSAAFPLAGQAALLELPRHRGGRVDWFSASATAPLDGGQSVHGRAYPTALHYPGAPNSRWWEIENAAVDIAGYPPDSSHFATTLLIELISSHGDDWFLFPLDAAAGSVVTLPSVTVTDSFGDVYPVTPPAGWELFRTSGLTASSLAVWLRALSPIEGQPVEDVLLGLDEYANVLWAVERRTGGHEVAGSGAAPPPDRPGAPEPAPAYAYRPGQGAAPCWHPYEVTEGPDGRRRFVQRRLADLSGAEPTLTPAAAAEVLRVRIPGGGEVVHEIEPATVPSIGVVLERRHRLARDVHGNPVLWMQRQRTPFLRPPSRALRFDVLAETTPAP